MTTWTLTLGDCLDPATGLIVLPDQSVGVTITDPPYNEYTHAKHARGGRYDGGPELERIPFAPLGDAAPLAREIVRVTQRWAIVFTSYRQIEEWAQAFEAHGWVCVRVMPWIKPDASPQFTGDRPGTGWEPIVCAHPRGRMRWNGGGGKGVYECTRGQDGDRLHPTQKPRALMEALVRDFTDPGELVCDPFAGSGTTAVACRRLGRGFVGWEKDPDYHAAAIKRIEAARQQYELIQAADLGAA